MTVDKQLLFKRRIAEAEVDVPGVGTVRVRGLTREEVLSARDLPDVAAIERRMVAAGMVDPVLTEAEVGLWQKASPAGELQPVTQRIEELSGMTEGAAKEAYLDFENTDGAEFRVLPGDEAGHDRGPDAG